MATRPPLAIGEWYHCYNRGVDKRKIFLNKKDYERFLSYLYVANSDKSVHISNLKNRTLPDILDSSSFERGLPIVELGAYALMPNHCHFVLKEIQEGGIALFMQKVFTGYTMYFNKKYERTGSLLAGTFKSKHVVDNRYMKWLVSYVHLNPVEIFEPAWKEGRGNLKEIEEFLSRYRYSSFPDFFSFKRPEQKIIGTDIFNLYDSKPAVKEMLEEAQEYYREISRFNLDTFETMHYRCRA